MTEDIPPPESVKHFYRRYLECCNARDHARLGEFVADEIMVNDTVWRLDRYVAALRAMVEPFPGYRWEPRHLLVDGDRLAACFTDTGVTRDGRRVDTVEFAHYRIERGKIVEVRGVWVPTGTSVLDQF